MEHDTDRADAYAARDLLRQLFTEAMDVETLERFQAHDGGVIKVDLIRGTAAFASGHTYPEILIKVKKGLGRLAGPTIALQDLRIRARVRFRSTRRPA